MSSLAHAFGSSAHTRPAPPQTSDRQLWDFTLSRRSFIRAAAGTAGLVAGSQLLMPGLAHASRGSAVPKPLPWCTQIDDLGCFHFFFPGHAAEHATITDFNGFIGVGEWGPGTGKDDHGTTLYWAADLRFMDGEFVGLDGHRHLGAFAFV